MNKEDAYEHIDFDEFMEPLKIFEAVGCGSNDVYNQRENLKAWGWYWNPQRKVWQYEARDENDLCIKALGKLGLTWRIQK